MVKRILMIAFHFPPHQGGSGIHRTLKFAEHLPKHGYEPVVLTPHRRAYPDGVAESPSGDGARFSMHPAFCVDSGRHLAFKGRYLRLLALPDRWISWWLGAVPVGLRLVRTMRPDVIFSTYPIATAHLIGLTLHRLTGIPWIADMRDPMIDEVHPAHPLVRRAYAWIEAKTVRYSARIVCTTSGAAAHYRRKYPAVPPSRFCVIENGYDEDAFSALPAKPDFQASKSSPVTLLHSGAIYPLERDPRQLFEALGRLLASGRIAAETFRLVLRATGHDAHLRTLVSQHGIEPIVDIVPPLPFHDAMLEMLSADGLLLLQASNCNNQIPAKAYEYLRAQRPILALTDLQGDTGKLLRGVGIDAIAPLNSVEQIERALLDFLDDVRHGTAVIVTREVSVPYSRRARAKELADLLDELLQR